MRWWFDGHGWKMAVVADFTQNPARGEWSGGERRLMGEKAEVAGERRMVAGGTITHDDETACSGF
jgi:hypothetical protein